METCVMIKKSSLIELIKYFLKLGTTGFGGPVALVGYMHRDLVEKRKWITDDDYKEGLALSQLAPGPLAAQLAIYLGYVDYKIIGATLVGGAFVLPSFLMVLALGYGYIQYHGLPWMQSMFYGVGAAVIGIIAISSYKLTKKTIGKEWILWIVFFVLAVTTFLTESEYIWLMLAAGFVVWFYKSPPSFKISSQYLLMKNSLVFGGSFLKQGHLYLVVVWLLFLFYMVVW